MSTVEQSSTPPAPGAFYVIGGTLPSDAPSYVPRRADHDLLAGLRAGEFCYVLNTRQMGKSSLMIRTARALQAEGVTVAALDLTAVGQNLTPEQWYDGLLVSLAEQLHLEDALEDFWNDNRKLGPLQRFMTAVRQVVLPRIPKRLAVFVDEIDAVRSLPFPADEFFAAIRECFNRRRLDPEYGKLTFCLLGVATPADLIRDTRLSPFNIGQRVTLSDFTLPEAAPLAAGLGAQGPSLLSRVLFWTGGHPYMTQRLCRALADSGASDVRDVDDACGRLFLTKQARETDDNLAFVRSRLLRSEADPAALLDLYRQVRAGRRVTDDETSPLCGVLRLSGVVNAPNGTLRVRNHVYDRVFDGDWVRAHMPDAEARRQRDAYRRGALRTASLASIVLILMGALSAWALREKSVAQANARTTREALAATADALHAASSAEADAQRQRNRAQEQAAHAERASLFARRRNAEAQRQARRALRFARAEQSANARATAAARQAHAEARNARRQTELALAQKRLASASARSARSSAAEARRQRKSALGATQKARNLLQVSGLQLAQQAWDSEAGTAAQVRDQLAACRARPVGDGRERFEWRLQWAQLHGAAAAVRSRQPGDCQAAVAPGGLLIALDAANRLHRASVAGGRVGPDVDLGALAPLVAAALSPDGARVALARRDGAVEVRDTRTLRRLASWPGDAGEVTALWFPRAGGTLQGLTPGQGVQEWDAASGRRRRHWTEDQYQAAGGRWSGDWFSLDAWSGDLRRRAVVHGSGSIMLADLAGAAGAAPSILGQGAEVTALAFSDDGRTLAAGDATGGVVLWDAASGRRRSDAVPALPADASGNQTPTVALAFSPDGATLAEGGANGLIRLCGLNSTALPLTLKGHTAPIAHLGFSPDGRWLASSDGGGAARAWDLDALRAAPPTLPSGGAVAALAFSSGGTLFGGVGADGQAALWDARTGRARPLPDFVRPAPGGTRTVRALAFSPDGRVAAAGGSDAGPGGGKTWLQFWERAAGRAGPRWEAPADVAWGGPGGGGATALAFSPDGRLAAGSLARRDAPEGDRPAVGVWDTASGRLLRTVAGFGGAVNGLCFAPGARTLYVACQGGMVRCLDTRTWTESRRLPDALDVLAVAASPRGGLVASGDVGGRILLTRTDGWRVETLTGTIGKVLGLAFSPDGRTLASTGADATVRLWDVSTGRQTRTVPADHGGCLCIAFSPDSTLLAGGDGAGQVHLWRAASPARVCAWERQDRGPTAPAPAWSTPEGRAAAAAALWRDVESERVQAPGAGRGPNMLGALGLWTSDGAAAHVSTDAGTVRLDVTRAGPHPWNVQLSQGGLDLKNGQTYALQFLARADHPLAIDVQLQRDVPNHDDVGLYAGVTLPPEWRPYRFTFQAKGATPFHTHFLVESGAGTLWLRHLFLAPIAGPPSTPGADDKGRAERLLAEIQARRVPSGAGAAANILAPFPWNVRVQPGAAAVLEAGPRDAAGVDVSRTDGTDWHVMLARSRLPLVSGGRYLLQFRARADRPVRLRLNTEASDDPHPHNGLEESLGLTTQWRAFRFPFVMGDCPGTSDLCVCVGQGVNRVTFADAVLVPDGEVGTAAHP